MWMWMGARACLCYEALTRRDVKEEHTRVLVLSAFLRAKDPIDKRERSEFLQKRFQRYARVVVLGVLRRTVFWAKSSALP